MDSQWLKTLRAVAEAEVDCGGQKTRQRGLDTLALLHIAEVAQEFVDSTGPFRQVLGSRKHFIALSLALKRPTPLRAAPLAECANGHKELSRP